MNFISWAFVLLLIPVLVARLTIGMRHTEPAFLGFVTLASTVFVCWYFPICILVLLTSLTVDYVAAILIDDAPPAATRRRWLLAASMGTNLALLGFFKYANFFLAQTNRLAAFVHAPALSTSHLNIILPIGISFYTFGSMSYTIDVYRGKLKPLRSFARFYFFLTFFPHMVAGPIIRANQFFYQMRRRRRPSLRVFNEGGYQIIRGLFLKMVCADNISPAVNANWAQGYQPHTPTLQVFTLAVLFSAQIFCDFEGYSSIARGLAYWLGFRFPINFNNPYAARSFSNFWERWHITLSRWLRDYLYIPLGGSRGSPACTYLNLMIVMTLGGLWHGAALTFIAWGILHGFSLAVERFFDLNRPDGPRRFWVIAGLWYAVVQLVVLLTWVLFRCESIRGAGTFIGNLASFQPGRATAPVLWACLCLLPVVLMHVHAVLVEWSWLRPLGRSAQAGLAALMLFAILSYYGQSSEFIYFQF